MTLLSSTTVRSERTKRTRGAGAVWVAIGVVALLLPLGCAEKPSLGSQAWRCTTNEDCRYGRTCHEGSCLTAEQMAASDVVAGSDVKGDVAIVCPPGSCAPGAGQTEECGNCGSKIRICSEDCAWGEWGPCQREGECAAATEDSEPCGLCGQRSRVCEEDCAWSGWGDCDGEGTCAPGAEENVICGNCGQTTRACGDDCEWALVGDCEGQGECSPGVDTTEACGICGTRTRGCDGDCQFLPWGECIEGVGICAIGETEDVPCGSCGTRTRVCDDTCQWQEGACEDEGECVAGTLAEEDCGNCGRRSRVCDATCRWPAWGRCEGEGPCAPAEEAHENCPDCGARDRVCDDLCQWGLWTPCTGPPACLEAGACTPEGVCRGTMVIVPAGTFRMGSPDGEGLPEERPRHQVTLAAFEIDRHEVTVADFALFLDAMGNEDREGNLYMELTDVDAPIELVLGRYEPRQTCENQPGGAMTLTCADHPVLEVTWYGARAYCAWVGKRLPSEAEWERAAAGTESTVFPWGGNVPATPHASCAETACADGFRHTSPIGRFPDGDSEAGCRDMAGNVWEWVEDAYHATYDGAPIDGSAWLVPASTSRVARGGGWDDPLEDLRTRRRARYASDATPNDGVGFRCAR